jgi:ketosteroid isomerase-like protein
MTSALRPARTLLLATVLGTLATGSLAAPVKAQWSRTYEQFYHPGRFNFTFRREYQAADRLFNAFDYGHAILYERLLNDPVAAARELETEEYDYITTKLLVSPPRLPLEEAAIEVNYARMVPEAKMMFDWAHLLHRQIYDVLASESMSQAEKDFTIAQLVGYYKSRGDLAFSSVPKNMELMEGQPYSLAFRQRYPKFNGLIWGYHWLQVGLYEPLVIGRTREERQSGVTAAVARFRQMLENAPENMPRVMPMTAAIAPTFAARYPEPSIIFDNLHAMHDVVSDILANEKVPRSGKRAAILEAASRYRDATSFPMSIAEWKSMGTMMGVENMGGPAVGFLAAFPTPTVQRGATMAEAMKGMHHDHAAPAAAAPAPKPGIAPTSEPAANVPSSDSADVAAAAERFRAALSRGDSATVLAMLAPDLQVLESGELESRAQYRHHHLPADSEYAMALRATHSVSAVVVHGDAAWVTSTSTSQGTVKGRAINSAGAELLVLSRAGAGAPWQIRAIHWSSRRRSP